MAISELATRVNITMSKELYEWVTKRAKELSLSRSSLICMAVGQYKTQVVMTDLVSRIPPIELQKIIDKMSQEKA